VDNAASSASCSGSVFRMATVAERPALNNLVDKAKISSFNGRHEVVAVKGVGDGVLGLAGMTGVDGAE